MNFAWRFRRLLAGAALAASATVFPVSAAETPCDLIAEAQVPPAQPSERVRIEEIDGRRVIVLLPPGYDEDTATRFPVVYLLHGGSLNADTFVSWLDVLALTEPVDRRAIIVAPDGTPAPFWLDWHSGARKDATAFTDIIIPWIDGHYRTIADSRHRAIAGISAGGLGALQLAGRRPDLFAAVAGIEALADLSTRQPGYTVIVSLAQMAAGLCYSDRPADIFGMFGDPVTNEIGWRKVNPPDLAGNYGSLGVHLYTGNGIPCDAEDARELSYFFATQFLVVKPSNDALDAALTRAGVAHTYDLRSCGLHTPKYWDEQIAAWWDDLFTAFGRAAPAVFDYRSAEPSFSVWDWHFSTAPDRAAEFLSVSDASRTGMGLTGSGLVDVTTAGYFAPGQIVRLRGATASTAVADGLGRISFGVSLGPSHTQQQFTPAARAIEALGGYWMSLHVRFSPVPATG